MYNYSEKEYEIFSRLFILNEFSEDNLKILSKIKIGIVGIGGIGCPLSQYLVSSGVKELLLVDGDIIERKKTFLYVVAYKRANPSQKADLIRIYNSDIANKIDLVRDLYNDLGVQKIVENYIEARRQDLNTLINNITVQDEKKSSFKELIKLLLDRNF